MEPSNGYGKPIIVCRPMSQGYAMASDTPVPGAVVAQALADFTGKRGVVKAMIRKF